MAPFAAFFNAIRTVLGSGKAAKLAADKLGPSFKGGPIGGDKTAGMGGGKGLGSFVKDNFFEQNDMLGMKMPTREATAPLRAMGSIFTGNTATPEGMTGIVSDTVSNVIGGLAVNAQGLASTATPGARTGIDVAAEGFARALEAPSMKLEAMGALIEGDVIGAMKLSIMSTIEFHKQLAMLPANIARWSRSLLDSQYAMAQFSGNIQAVQQQELIRTMQRQIKSGASTAGSTQKLMEAVNDFQDEIQPYLDAFLNVMMELFAGFMRGLTTILDLVQKMTILGKVIEALTTWLQGDDDPFSFMDWMVGTGNSGSGGKSRSLAYNAGMSLGSLAANPF